MPEPKTAFVISGRPICLLACFPDATPCCLDATYTTGCGSKAFFAGLNTTGSIPPVERFVDASHHPRYVFRAVKNPLSRGRRVVFARGGIFVARLCVLTCTPPTIFADMLKAPGVKEKGHTPSYVPVCVSTTGRMLPVGGVRLHPYHPWYVFAWSCLGVCK